MYLFEVAWTIVDVHKKGNVRQILALKLQHGNANVKPLGLNVACKYAMNI